VEIDPAAPAMIRSVRGFGYLFDSAEAPKAEVKV